MDRVPRPPQRMAGHKGSLLWREGRSQNVHICIVQERAKITSFPMEESLVSLIYSWHVSVCKCLPHKSAFSYKQHAGVPNTFHIVRLIAKITFFLLLGAIGHSNLSDSFLYLCNWCVECVLLHHAMSFYIQLGDHHTKHDHHQRKLW